MVTLPHLKTSQIRLVASQPPEILAYNHLSSATFRSDYDKKVESRVRCLTLMMRGWSPGSSTPRKVALTPPTGIEAGWDQREREAASCSQSSLVRVRVVRLSQCLQLHSPTLNTLIRVTPDTCNHSPASPVSNISSPPAHQ